MCCAVFEYLVLMDAQGDGIFCSWFVGFCEFTGILNGGGGVS